MTRPHPGSPLAYYPTMSSAFTDLRADQQRLDAELGELAWDLQEDLYYPNTNAVWGMLTGSKKRVAESTLHRFGKRVADGMSRVTEPYGYADSRIYTAAFVGAIIETGSDQPNQVRMGQDEALASSIAFKERVPDHLIDALEIQFDEVARWQAEAQQLLADLEDSGTSLTALRTIEQKLGALKDVIGQEISSGRPARSQEQEQAQDLDRPALTPLDQAPEIGTPDLAPADLSVERD